MLSSGVWFEDVFGNWNVYARMGLARRNAEECLQSVNQVHGQLRRRRKAIRARLGRIERERQGSSTIG